jgi:hypothetical protein
VHTLRAIVAGCVAQFAQQQRSLLGIGGVESLIFLRKCAKMETSGNVARESWTAFKPRGGRCWRSSRRNLAYPTGVCYDSFFKHIRFSSILRGGAKSCFV